MKSYISIGNDEKVVDEKEYLYHRIINGVPEGVADYIPGSSLPLEYNMDLMDGSN